MKTTTKHLINIFSFVLLTIFLVFFSNKHGYEGDDLNSLVPAMHLDEMRDGLIEGYKYDWQPLSYQLSHVLFQATHEPQSMFLIAPVSMALSLLILFLIVNRKFGTNLLLFSCLLLMIPEFIYTGLYYNSHAPACLVYVVAMWFLYTLKPNEHLLRSAIIIGTLAAVSVLFRFDFVLAVPMLITMFYLQTKSIRYSFVVVIVGILVGLLAFMLNILNFSDLIEIYQTSSQEIHEKAADGGWDRYFKTMVLTAILTPVGWLFFLTGLGLFLFKNNEIKRSDCYWILLAVLPLFYPLKDLLSSKYALPLLIWALVFGAYVFSKLLVFTSLTFYKLFSGFCLVSSFILLGIYFNVDNKKPYFDLSLNPIRPISGHDGDRSWGGYFYEYLKVKSSNMHAEGYIQSKNLVRQINESKEKTFLIVGKQNVFEMSSAGWRYVQMFLAAQANAKSQVISKNHIVIDIDKKKVHLCEEKNCLNTTELADPNLEIIYPDLSNF